MTCTNCNGWELAHGDLVCSWCGQNYIRFTLTLNPTHLSTADYPPPVELRIRNTSPVAPVTLQSFDLHQTWINLLPGQDLTPTLAPNTQYTLLLDVDTFASTEPQATLAVTAQYAPEPQTATLYLASPTET